MRLRAYLGTVSCFWIQNVFIMQQVSAWLKEEILEEVFHLGLGDCCFDCLSKSFTLFEERCFNPFAILNFLIYLVLDNNKFSRNIYSIRKNILFQVLF